MSLCRRFAVVCRYGMYHVRATLVNNVSSLTVPTTVIQVGDNVTSVDVRVADWLVPVNAPVSVKVDCPRGWPVILTVDMGDGLTLTLARYDRHLDTITAGLIS